MKKSAESAEFWMGFTDRENLKNARIFIDNLNFLTDLCIYKPNRVLDLDEGKKKKKEDDIYDDGDPEDEFEFLNLTELL